MKLKIWNNFKHEIHYLHFRWDPDRGYLLDNPIKAFKGLEGWSLLTVTEWLRLRNWFSKEI